jgi:putative ABC transport system permease protein
VIAVIGTALVFSLTMLIGALRDNFLHEVDGTLDGLGADYFLVSDQAVGPFSGFVLIDPAGADAAAASAGGTAGPAVLVRQPIRVGTKIIDTNVFGHRIGGLGAPPVTRGRPVGAPGEIVVDRSAGLEPGDSVVVGGFPSQVVGLTEGRTLGAGAPNGYMPLEDAQARFLGGRSVATVLLVQSQRAPVAPPGLAVSTRDQAADQLVRPFRQAITSLALLAVILWAVAAAIVGSSLYLTVIERTRDFAVFRATGTTTRSLVVGLTVQALALTLTAALAAIGLALVLAPLFPLPITVTGVQMGLVVVVAVGVGLVASIAGLRRAIRVEPALAFGGPG